MEPGFAREGGCLIPQRDLACLLKLRHDEGLSMPRRRDALTLSRIAYLQRIVQWISSAGF